MNIIKPSIPLPISLNFPAQKYEKHGGASLLSVVEKKKYVEVWTDHVVESGEQQFGLKKINRSCTHNVLIVRP